MERNYRDTKFIITGLIAIIICNFANNNLQIFIPLSLQGYRHYNYDFVYAGRDNKEKICHIVINELFVENGENETIL
jgi:hypothetical protein